LLRSTGAALTTAAVTAGIEFFKLQHSPALDCFRLTVPGMLLLGRFFSIWDIFAYWLAISIGVLLDTQIRCAAEPASLPGGNGVSC
jgi:Protein of unknown function (DUF2809)